MLTLTENASTIVRDLTDQALGTPEAGLRISTEATPQAAFAVSTVLAPEAGDARVEQDGATIYLDARAARELDHMVLDAGLDTQGDVRFALAPRA